MFSRYKKLRLELYSLIILKFWQLEPQYSDKLYSHIKKCALQNFYEQNF